MESPDEFYEKIIKNGKGNFPQMESQFNIMGKDLGSNIVKVLLGNERGFKILPNNDAKILLNKL